MSIYLGDTKISGAGVQVDSALSDTSTRPVENKVVTEALEDVGYNTWTKPADWIDIRSGALGNSVYLLVGHSADYSSYAKFSLLSEVSTAANTYDVYVDGVKQATTASGTATVLDWQTLALTSGFDITTPTNLRAHIVRVTPTVSTDTLTRVRTVGITGQQEQGLLWAHYSLSNEIAIDSAFGAETGKKLYLLQAITAKNDLITYTVTSAGTSGLYQTFAYCSALVKIPVLKASTNTYSGGMYLTFKDVPAKKITIKNNGPFIMSGFRRTKVTEFDIENPIRLQSNTGADNSATEVSKLKKMPALASSASNTTFLATGWTSLEDTFIDDTPSTARTFLRFSGTSSSPVLGLKGLVVSNEAPFDGSSPQINVSYTGLDRAALVNLFNSLPTVSDSQVINITGATGASDLDATDLAIATGKGWTVTR